MTTSWGSELWDQFEPIKKHTDKGIEFLQKFCNFSRERQTIENEYAGKIKQLVKKYQPSKKDEEAYNRFTCTKAFVGLLKELNSVALQHETISENIVTTVTKEALMLGVELKAERKGIIKEGEKEEKKLQDSIDTLNRVKKHYEQAHKAFEQAKAAFNRADNDPNQTKAAVERLKSIMNTKNQLREDSKNDYILQLQKTNTAQKEHYFTNMPAVFQKMQDMDEKRTRSLGEFYKKFSISQNDVNPILVKCLEAMVQEAEQIKPSTDSVMVTDKYKSGYVPPGDITFEDLDVEPGHHPKPVDTDSISSELEIPVTPSNGSSGGTISGKTKKTKRKIGLFSKKDTDSPDRKNRILQKSSFRRKDEPKEDFSHLQPTQQKKKLQEKIDELNAKIDKEQKEREGLLKMRDVYMKNSSLGDPTSVDGQLQQIGKRMDDYRLELQKYQKYVGNAPYSNSSNRNSFMDKAEGKPVSTSGKSQTLPKEQVNSPSQNASTPPPPDFTIPAPPPIDGLSTSSTQSLPNASSPANSTFDDSRHSIGQLRPESTFDEDFGDEVVLCTCIALYSFDATEGSSLSLQADDTYDVMEYDSGDGWTRVRKGSEEGYVPTSYIQIDN
ncbi:formin-binding protein 1-like isoform X2 [Antedon mediterranea]|uniref:formin-binding protein 1-like isoform X2 n=1 Tax=Antedon mediterranea TaxID=105859 RepID=UPI003AF980F0